MKPVNTSIEKRKKQLEREKNRLEKELAKLDQKSSDAHSEEDRAQLVEEFQGNLELSKNLLKMFNDVKKALEKVEAGTYGICEFCNIAIPNGRLEIQPASIICVGCESKRKNKRWWMVWKRQA